MRHALDSMLSQAIAADVLHSVVVDDPAGAADELERAVDASPTPPWLPHVWASAAMVGRGVENRSSSHALRRLRADGSNGSRAAPRSR